MNDGGECLVKESTAKLDFWEAVVVIGEFFRVAGVGGRSVRVGGYDRCWWGCSGCLLFS